MSSVARFAKGTMLKFLPTSFWRQETRIVDSFFTCFKYTSRRPLWKVGVSSFLRKCHFSPDKHGYISGNCLFSSTYYLNQHIRIKIGNERSLRRQLARKVCCVTQQRVTKQHRSSSI